MSDQTFRDEWLRNKNVVFRQMLERQEFESAAEYAIMFSALYADQSRDMENASWELAQVFENTAFMLKAMCKHSEADAFNSRAETMRQKLDHEELERMLAAPPVMPDVYGPNDKPFELLMRDLVAGAWQACGKPRQFMAWQVHVSQPWRLFASYNDLAIWIFDLEATIKDEKGRTGREHFMRSARNPAVLVQPAQDGKTVREQMINRAVLKIHARQFANGASKVMLVGQYLCKLVGPQPKPPQTS